MINEVTAGFIGAGGIARSHAYALNSLKYYYSDVPSAHLVAVTSLNPESRKNFAERFGFRESTDFQHFIANDKIDTVFILGPNKVHAEHLKAAVAMPSIKRIYIEKPLCSTKEEEEEIAFIVSKYPSIKFQAGFQFLFTPSVREAIKLWRTGMFGKLLHFDIKYYHGDYLNRKYRDKRQTRLTPAPDGGAMADLGSHAISMLMAFAGDDLQVTSAIQSGSFPDVNPLSDLFSLITLRSQSTGAAGTISASRIASGTGDTLSMELYAEKGTLRLSTNNPSFFEYFTEESGMWINRPTGSNYGNITSFPSGHVSPGWLRSMIHAHYVFITGNDDESFVPGIDHALKVQRIVREASEAMEVFRKSNL
jgi:predicted dehydrogenase